MQQGVMEGASLPMFMNETPHSIKEFEAKLLLGPFT